jgi:hypothetical protein
MVVSDQSVAALAILLQHCHDVRTIYTTLCRTRYESEDPYTAPVSEIVLDALSRVDELFRRFKAVENIIVEHYHNTGRQDELLRRVASFGWTMVGRDHPIWDDDFVFCPGPIDDEDD